MGLMSDSAGISLQFYDANVEPSGGPVHGKFTYLCSVHRSTVPTSAEPLTAAELQNPGSEDWLTVVAVADTEQRLLEIAPLASRAPTCALSSCASCRVMVHLYVGSMTRPQTFPSRTVIASGPVIFVPKEGEPEKKVPKVNVVHVKVFDPAVPMDSSHKMIHEFNGLASMLATLTPD